MRRNHALFLFPALSIHLFACRTGKVPGEPSLDTGALSDGADGTTVVPDEDGDGFTADEDCDDGDPAVNPAAVEVCDGIDNDCNEKVDDDDDGLDLSTAEVFFVDADDDGFGAPETAFSACAKPANSADNDLDCDDGDPAVNPGAFEQCDGIDNDCDPATDETTIDIDGDGFFDKACGGLDCDDGDRAVNPDAEEVCDDGIDNDCDGSSGVCAPSGDIPFAEADAILRGEAAGDRAALGDPGFAGAGDVNGDGVGDLIVGAVFNDAAATDAGAAYILFGPLSGESNLSSADAKITGAQESDLLGRAVNGLGDTNGDGFDDVVATALFSDAGGTDGGATYVFLGPVSGTVSADAADTVLLAAGAGDQIADVERPGDVNGDGTPDLLFSAQFHDSAGENAGAAYLILSPSGGEIDLATDGIRIDGATPREELGSALGAGDFNGDGVQDLLLGARFADTNGDNSGSVYLMEGPITADMDVGSADSVYMGAVPGDQLGNFASVASAGDADGDGFEDILMGSRENAGGGIKQGAAFLVLGPNSPGPQSVAEADVIFNGEATRDFTGESVDGLGDFDGDGVGDLLIGSGFADVGTSNGGAAYLVLGPVTPGTWSLSDADARYAPEADDDRVRIQAAGDLDGDGKADLLLGAQNNDATGDFAGAVYLFYGTGL